MARPTKLTEELIEKAKEYILSCEDSTEQELTGLSVKGTELYKNKVVVNLPTAEGLAHELDINRDTIYAWCKGKDELSLEFSDIIESLREKQARMLINKGLSGDYNPTIAKVLLSKHGYTEKTETDITSGGEKLSMSPEHLAIASEYEAKLKGQL